MTTRLPLLPIVGVGSTSPTRTTTDRLELLETLIAAPRFDPVFRSDVITVGPDHPAFGWRCRVAGCERGRETTREFCSTHDGEWGEWQRAGGDIVGFRDQAQPLQPRGGRGRTPCLVCPHALAYGGEGLCYLHTENLVSWQAYQRRKGRPDGVDVFLIGREPYPDFGKCRVVACSDPAAQWLGFCVVHGSRYKAAGLPGGARCGGAAGKHLPAERPEALYEDRAAFERWCVQENPIARMDGRLSLLGLRPLVRAEIKWTIVQHIQGPTEGAHWPLTFVQRVVNYCRLQDVSSLADLDLDRFRQDSVNVSKIARRMLRYLQLLYFTREDTKEIGYIELDHFGVRLKQSAGHVDLTGVSQRWLRDLLWEWLENRLLTDPPRSITPIANPKRGCMELSAFLESRAPEGGHNPSFLTRQHMLDFVVDQRYRASHGLKSLAIHDVRTGEPNTVKAATVSRVFDGARQVLRAAMENGRASQLGVDNAFVVALPHGGNSRGGRRKPFSDEMARALANGANLQRFDDMDVEDRGLRLVWEALVLTGRRCGEVLEVRLECIGRYKGLPMFWHDQTKVGNMDEGIRIPERLFQAIGQRQAKTIARFVQRHGRPPTAQERSEIALFPRRGTNRSLLKSVSYGWFQSLFSDWVATLDLAHCVAHQARHTLATNLLKAGANLTHVKRYLGQVSDAMAEHYVHLANTDPKLEQALNAVWVAGPGSAEPGLVLSAGEDMTREQAEALAIDLTRRSTPAEGGFCTFQPVVNGDACPWNVDCHNCDKFVLSGADLVYWHRKREQWRTVAEGADDPKVADYLHDFFEPTARAIDGLEKALAAVGLLDEALTLDLRRPQDYFGRVWSTAFRAQELARHEAETDEEAA
ncbi:tyrosine-type recombinase/integrase [Streptomyces sp. NBC_00582]|uniref:tyrosine-type recombinase/integrase n=1 Tax=Streptomyces sp. NBC_00582 TaxID=2975783 RepID=UPI002E7FD824|nr:site-specific integrase [Streptomyces sp. NBC_00582]WUB60408.1 site-specific integrase [Streptomyces sp. NBC_00582]WUB61719.1 site-specific integrase [Streptomyces sp. NBC_00582]